MASETVLYLLIAVLLILAVLLAAFILKSRGSKASSEIVALEKRLQEINDQVRSQMLAMMTLVKDSAEKNATWIQSQDQTNRKSVSELHERLGHLGETTKQMITVGRDIASLQDILKGPKSRGGFGEWMMERIMEDILPREHYEFQYKFRDGALVDAVIRLGDGLIVVDSKFPLENYKRLSTEENPEESLKAFYRDVKKHIDDISSKYILTDEGTYDFALMYVPSEAVYHEITSAKADGSRKLLEEARKKQVIPVSPNTFYLYLQTILRGLKGLKIEESAKEILEGIGKLDLLFGQSLGELQKVGGHLSNALSAYERTSQKMTKLQSQIERLSKSDDESSPAADEAV